MLGCAAASVSRHRSCLRTGVRRLEPCARRQASLCPGAALGQCLNRSASEPRAALPARGPHGCSWTRPPHAACPLPLATNARFRTRGRGAVWCCIRTQRGESGRLCPRTWRRGCFGRARFTQPTAAGVRTAPRRLQSYAAQHTAFGDSSVVIMRARACETRVVQRVAHTLSSQRHWIGQNTGMLAL